MFRALLFLALLAVPVTAHGQPWLSASHEAKRFTSFFFDDRTGDGTSCVCCKGVISSAELTGDSSGRRTCLAEHGIEIESFLTQYYQGVTSGGAEQTFRYGAKFDLLFDFDTEELGLWRGGRLRCHAAKWQFGQNSIADAAFLAPVNLDQLAPTPESSFALTLLMLEQNFGGGFAAMIGRYSLLDLFARDFDRTIRQWS